MSAELTHRGNAQVVAPEALRRVLRHDGERCYCRPADSGVEWDAGRCPTHRRETAESAAQVSA